ncbi:unnamed protein product [Choristocarpus tenellus]
MASDSMVPEGQYTSIVYTAIQEGRFTDAVQVLTFELGNFPRSRAALSLLSYCYYQMQDFNAAASMYEQLVKVCPGVEEYQVYLAQSLYKAAMYPEATRAAVRVDSSQYQQRVLALQSAIKYEQDDLPACKSLIDQCLSDDPDTIISYASIAFKEGDYEDAHQKYMDAMNTLGYQADLAYNIALCYYKENEFAPALKHIDEIIERGEREHPELAIGTNNDGIEVRSVGNSQVLQVSQ